MTLLVVIALGGLLAAALIDLGIVPQLRQTALHDPERAEHGAGTIGAVSYLRSALLALVPAAAGAVAVLAWLDGERGSGADLDRTHDAYATVIRQIDRLPWPWFTAAAVALLALPAAAVYLHARRRSARARADALSRSRRLLEEQQAAGRLEPLPPNDAMNAMMARVMECDEALRRAEDTVAGATGRDRDTARLRRWIAEALEAHRQFDLDRRLDTTTVAAAMFAPRATGVARLTRALLGPGLHDTVGGAARGLAGLAAIACIPVALALLLHLSAPPLRQQLATLDAEIADRRDRLILADSLAAARRDWESASSPAGGPARLTAADRSLFARLARGYEATIASSDLAPRAPADPGDAPEARTDVGRALVRDTILRIAADRAPSPRVRRPTLGEIAALGEDGRATLDRVADALADGPRSQVGTDFEAALIAAATDRPALLATLRRHAPEWLAATPEPDMESAERVSRFDAAIRGAGFASLKDVFAEIEAARRYRTLTALAAAESAGPWQAALESSPGERGTARYGHVVNLIATVIPPPTDAPIDADAILPVVAEQPPALDVPAESPTAVDAASEALDALAKRLTRDGDAFAAIPETEVAAVDGVRRQIDGLVQYEDFFPSQLGAENESPRGRLLVRLASLTRPDTAEPAADTNRANLERGRDFVSLRGFSRIGGVLIGRTDTGDEAADIRHLEWEFESDGIRLIAIDASGRRHESRRLPCDLVELALAYAADGRPTTVTMVTTMNVPDLRILLHPVLVDTALGGDAIDLDRLVDVHTGGTEWRSDAEASVQRQLWMYRFAWAQRILAFEPLWPLVGEPADDFRELARQVDARVRSEEEEFAALLGDAAVFADPSRCVVAAKPAYFDPQVVAWLREGLPAADLATLAAAIRTQAVAAYAAEGGVAFEKAAAHARANPDAAADISRRIDAYNASLGTNPLARLLARRSGEDTGKTPEPETKEAIEADMATLDSLRKGLLPAFRRSLFQLPQFVVWSGVRERKTPADGPLLPRSDANSARTGPFDFILQVAFESAPYFADGEPPTTGERIRELEQASDPDPWQFPAIAKRVQATVESELTDDERGVVRRLSDFAAMQRFFRRGLDGGLGPQFPVMRLRRLAEALADHPPLATVHTPRWNARPGLLERQCLEAWIQFRRALAAAEPVDGQGKSDGPAIPADIRRLMESVDSLLRDQVIRREAFEEALAALADAGSGDVAARRQENFETLVATFDRDTAAWEERLAAAAAALRTTAAAKEQPLFVAVAELVENLTERMADRRRLGIQTEDRRLAARALPP